MKERKLRHPIVIGILLILLGGCISNVPVSTVEPSDPGVAPPDSTQTVSVDSDSTDTVEPSVDNDKVEIIVTDTQTPVDEVFPTDTQAVTTAPSAKYCNWMEFISDIIVDAPVEQGTKVMPGMYFTKTWRVRNIGDCIWTPDYKIVLVEGDNMGASIEVPLDMLVMPGDVVDIALSMISPSFPGSYTGEWMLKNTEGELFGHGDDANLPLETTVQVLSLSGDTIFDFARARCLAEWHTGRADYLPCDGWRDVVIGFVRYLVDPAIEGKTKGNDPVLNMKPDNRDIGFVYGKYPAITVQEGDMFFARIGCMDQMYDCRVIFQLRFILEDGSDGAVRQWKKRYDGEPKKVRANLSELAGQKVWFILQVKVNGGHKVQADVFWEDPRIERKR
jgi:hypothetical protein